MEDYIPASAAFTALHLSTVIHTISSKIGSAAMIHMGTVSGIFTSIPPCFPETAV